MPLPALVKPPAAAADRAVDGQRAGADLVNGQHGRGGAELAGPGNGVVAARRPCPGHCRRWPGSDHSGPACRPTPLLMNSELSGARPSRSRCRSRVGGVRGIGGEIGAAGGGVRGGQNGGGRVADELTAGVDVAETAAGRVGDDSPQREGAAVVAPSVNGARAGVGQVQIEGSAGGWCGRRSRGGQVGGGAAVRVERDAAGGVGRQREAGKGLGGRNARLSLDGQIAPAERQGRTAVDQIGRRGKVAEIQQSTYRR